MTDPLTRRDALRRGVVGIAVATLAEYTAADDAPKTPADLPPRAFVTPAKDFEDVSRGSPIPHTLKGDALVNARLTPETWRLEVVAEDKATIDRPLTLDAKTALDLPALLEMGETHGVRFLKAMQCNNIARPLGQGLWEGVPLREVLKLCGTLVNPRRLYYWGFHNDKPEQKFQSSLAMPQELHRSREPRPATRDPGVCLPGRTFDADGRPSLLSRRVPIPTSLHVHLLSVRRFPRLTSPTASPASPARPS